MMVTAHKKSSPLVSRMCPSLACYADKFIFVIGGLTPENPLLDKVEFYTIETDTWSQAPSLNKARMGHSSCVAGSTICVFGGLNVKQLNSIEIIDAEAVVSCDDDASWHEFNIKNLRPGS